MILKLSILEAISDFELFFSNETIQCSNESVSLLNNFSGVVYSSAEVINLIHLVFDILEKLVKCFIEISVMSRNLYAFMLLTLHRH